MHFGCPISHIFATMDCAATIYKGFFEEEQASVRKPKEVRCPVGISLGTIGTAYHAIISYFASACVYMCVRVCKHGVRPCLRSVCAHASGALPTII